VARKKLASSFSQNPRAVRLPGDKIDRHVARDGSQARARDTYDCLLAARRVVGIDMPGRMKPTRRGVDQQASVFSVDADARGACALAHNSG